MIGLILAMISFGFQISKAVALQYEGAENCAASHSQLFSCGYLAVLFCNYNL